MTGDELPDLTFIELGAIEQWDSEGIPCAIRPGFASLNGYVRLPKRLRDWWDDTEEASAVLDDLIGHVEPEGMMTASSFARINSTADAGAIGARRWTKDRLRAEVETLAAQVAALANTVGSLGDDTSGLTD